MIIRNIPQNINFDRDALTEAIYLAVGRRFPIETTATRITLYDNFTGAELLAIKNAVIPLLSVIPDITT